MHKSRGFTPTVMTYGRERQLLLDSYLPTPRPDFPTPPFCVTLLMEILQKCQRVASTLLQQSQQSQARFYARQRHGSPFRPGDVLPPDVESSFCSKHRPADAQTSMRLLNQLRLPRVSISLSELRTNTLKLLESHDGKLPLSSFLCCYEATFGPLQTERRPNARPVGTDAIGADAQQAQQPEMQVGGGESGNGSKNYVLLEHLLTCVPGLLIQTAPDGSKSLHLQEGQKDLNQTGRPATQPRGKLETPADTTGNPSAVQENVRQLRREVVEMIKQQQPNCELLLSNFISTYHSQFGKQCRVADYGFSRLLDVIDSLNNVVHVVGRGPLRTLMLTHSIQLRRFTHDVLRVLKSEPKKSCPVSQFATLYEQVFRKVGLLQSGLGGERRFQAVRDSRTRPNQAGFCAGRGCADQIFTLRRILEFRHSYQQPTAVCFIDFAVAFDSVHRESLWRIMALDGVPAKIIAMIKAYYRFTIARVLVRNNLSQPFGIRSGVRQGCILSPILFNYAIDWILGRALRESDGVEFAPGHRLTDLDYADDIALLASSFGDLQSMVSRVNEVAKSVGLSINAGKTTVFSSCIPDQEKAPLGIDDCQLEEVDSFKYLGARLLPSGQIKDDIVSRIDAARWVFSSLRKCLWIRRDLSIATKIRVYRASVRSVLLYGCECWALRMEDDRKLEVFDHHCLRIILRVKFTDFVSNETVRARCDNIARITQAIQERRLRWFGHVLRRPPQELSVTALDPAPLPHWRRRRGGQFKTWLDTVRQDMEVVLGPSVFGLRRWRREWVELSRSAAADRHAWRGRFPELTVSLLNSELEFIASNYGVCDLNDLLNDMPENVITVDRTNSQEPTIVIPRRIQTAEQRFRTILFGIEVVEMLRRLQRFQIQFNKFIPAYHHAFYRQCRVSEYGFVKLIELLEALPHVVQVVEEAGEKCITLTNKFRLAIVREMIMSLLEKQPSNRLPLEELETTLLANHRPTLIPGDLGFSSLRDLLLSFPFVQILRLPAVTASPSASEELREWEEDAMDDEGLAEGSGDHSDQTVIGEYARKGEEAATHEQPKVEKEACAEAERYHTSEPTELPSTGGCEKPRDILCLTDRSHIKQLAYRCLQLLFGSPFCSLQEAEFKRRFVQSFNEEVDFDCIKREMSDFIQVLLSCTAPGFFSTIALSPVTDCDPILAPDGVPDQSVGEVTQGTVSQSTDEMNSGDRAGTPVPVIGATESVSTASSTQVIALTPIIVFARQLRTLLLRTRGRMMLALLETIYHNTFGLPLRPEAYGYPSISTLVGAVSFIAVIRGRGARATLFLAQDYLGRLAWRVAYKVQFRHELHWPKSVCGLLRPEFLQTVGRDQGVNSIHQTSPSGTSCFPSYAKTTTYSQHPHPVAMTSIPLEPGNQALPYPLNGILPVDGTVGVESVPRGISDPPQVQNYVNPLFLSSPIGEVAVGQPAYNFPPAAPTTAPYFFPMNQPTPGMMNFCPPVLSAVQTVPATKDFLPCTTLMSPSSGAAGLVNFPLELTSPTVTNALPEPVATTSFSGFDTATAEKTVPGTSAAMWSHYDQTAGLLPPVNPQLQPSPTIYNCLPPFWFRPLPLLPDTNKPPPTLQPMPSPAHQQVPHQQTPPALLCTLCPPNMPLGEMLSPDQKPVDQSGEKANNSESCPAVRLPTAPAGGTWQESLLPYYAPASAAYYRQLSLQNSDLQREGFCPSADVLFASKPLECGRLEADVSMGNDAPPPPAPSPRTSATVAKTDYPTPDMFWPLQTFWPYPQIPNATPAVVGAADIHVGTDLGRIYPCTDPTDGSAPVAAAAAAAAAASQQPLGVSGSPPRNRCEEGDWTLPISMTTESYDSNSKELDDSGSLD
ncbi:hypothetical protein SprV_0502002700 [Sparganum proliferum]